MVQETDPGDLGIIGEEGAGDDVVEASALAPSTVSETISDPRQAMAPADVTSSSPNPAVVGQPVTYSFRVPHFDPADPGAVSFDDMGADITGCTSGPINSAGTATCTEVYSQPGDHSIYAGYSGDDENGPTYDEAPLTQTVMEDSTTTTTLTSSANPCVSGHKVILTAIVEGQSPGADPTGWVTFTDGTTTLGLAKVKTAPGGGEQEARLSVRLRTVGQHSIQASYSGEQNYQASSSGTLAQEVQP